MSPGAQGLIRPSGSGSSLSDEGLSDDVVHSKVDRLSAGVMEGVHAESLGGDVDERLSEGHVAQVISGEGSVLTYSTFLSLID